jgi:hypothetical protein
MLDLVEVNQLVFVVNGYFGKASAWVNNQNALLPGYVRIFHKLGVIGIC